MTIHSYPKVYGLGHPALEALLDGEVSVEEKVDGSQFSFGVIDGQLCARSKRTQQHVDAPDKMFEAGINTARDLADDLHPEWVYRSEYLRAPKHNTLAYERHPERHIILFDVEVGPNDFLPPDERAAEAERLGLEVVPVMHTGPLSRVEEVYDLLERDSVLGGVKVEGVVIKNRRRFGRDGKMLCGKHVSEAFKEKHEKAWKKANPGGKDVVQTLIERYQTEARWAKAVQHLRERGELEGTPRDIGALIKEARTDLESEIEDEVKDALWNWCKGNVIRGAVRGLPEWYKRQLLESQFAEDESAA